jgi:hypothetical protein
MDQNLRLLCLDGGRPWTLLPVYPEAAHGSRESGQSAKAMQLFPHDRGYKHRRVRTSQAMTSLFVNLSW